MVYLVNKYFETVTFLVVFLFYFSIIEDSCVKVFVEKCSELLI